MCGLDKADEGGSCSLFDLVRVFEWVDCVFGCQRISPVIDDDIQYVICLLNDNLGS